MMQEFFAVMVVVVVAALAWYSVQVIRHLSARLSTLEEENAKLRLENLELWSNPKIEEFRLWKRVQELRREHGGDDEDDIQVRRRTDEIEAMIAEGRMS